MADRETDPGLASISDTSVLLNFAEALAALYPHLRTVRAHCYDPYDEVIEPLFWALVYGTFADKYGVIVPPARCHKYEFLVSQQLPANYVRVRPRQLPLLALEDSGEPVNLTEDTFARSELVFLNFGDATHHLTSPEIEGESYDDVTFHLTRAQLVEAHKASASCEDRVLVWLRNDSVTYEFVHVDGSPGAA